MAPSKWSTAVVEFCALSTTNALLFLEVTFNDGVVTKLSIQSILNEFSNGDDVKFNFCKTARKPYDLAVWHLLTFVKMIAPNSIDIRRDGWYNGRKEND